MVAMAKAHDERLVAEILAGRAIGTQHPRIVRMAVERARAAGIEEGRRQMRVDTLRRVIFEAQSRESVRRSAFLEWLRYELASAENAIEAIPVRKEDDRG